MVGTALKVRERQPLSPAGWLLSSLSKYSVCELFWTGLLKVDATQLTESNVCSLGDATNICVVSSPRCVIDSVAFYLYFIFLIVFSLYGSFLYHASSITVISFLPLTCNTMSQVYASGNYILWYLPAVRTKYEQKLGPTPMASKTGWGGFWWSLLSSIFLWSLFLFIWLTFLLFSVCYGNSF